MLWLHQAILDSGGYGQVAKAAKVGRSHLYHLTSGKRPLTARTAKSLMPVIKVPKKRWVEALLAA